MHLFGHFHVQVMKMYYVDSCLNPSHLITLIQKHSIVE